MNVDTPSTSTCRVSPPLAERNCSSSSCSPPQIPAFSKRSPRRFSPSHKVRRDLLGGRRGQGLTCRTRISRPDARRIQLGPDDPSLSSFGGLVAFNALLEECGVAASLQKVCAPLKTGRTVVYPMATQVRLLLDLLLAGGHRVFDLEHLAADPLFVLLAGGRVCCLDTLYTDLERFDEPTRQNLSALVTEQGLASLRGRLLTRLHIDIDPTVCQVFGDEIEGAECGYNAAYRGRPSYHPLLARIAETHGLLGAKLRPGNTAFGDDDAETINGWLDAVRSFLGDDPCLVTVRIDKAGDCTLVLKGIAERKMHFVVKARMTSDLLAEIAFSARWTTTARDALNKPLEQIAEIDFVRAEWRTQGLLALGRVRVVVVRSRLRQGGVKTGEEDWTLQAILSNDQLSEAEDLVLQYDERAGIEPLIAEMKQDWGLEKVSSKTFAANEAMLLLKCLAHNLMRRLVRRLAPTEAQRWRTAAVRRLLIVRPARLVRSGRRVSVRLGRLPVATKLE